MRCVFGWFALVVMVGCKQPVQVSAEPPPPAQDPHRIRLPHLRRIRPEASARFLTTGVLARATGDASVAASTGDASIAPTAPVADVPAPDDTQWASAWTDPAAVARLASDCNFHPPVEGTEPDPLDCAYSIEQQACAYDPCVGASRHCREACGHTCTNCDTTCRQACADCKQPCHDDACRQACAVPCGQCLSQCIAARDQCVSAHCTQLDTACEQRSIRRFAPCRAACARCTTQCRGGSDEACMSHCLATTPACTDAMIGQICEQVGPDYGAR